MKIISVWQLFILVLSFFVVACGPNKQNEAQQENIEAVDPALTKLDELNRKILNEPQNGGLYHERAKLYLENEEFNQALSDIGNSLEIDSTFADYYVTLSDIYLGMGKLKNTVESLDKAIELDSRNTQAYLKMAEISIVIRDYKEALNFIDKALQIDELEAKGFMLRGIILLENGDTIKGIRNFQKAIDVDQNYFDAHLQLGILFANKKNKLAIDYLNNALNIDPSSSEASYYLAMFYQETEKYDKAIQIYNNILEIEPDFYFALYNIGYIHLVYLQEFDIAIDYFTKTISLNPQYAGAFYNRGYTFELLGELEKSKRDYKKALELSPNYEKAIEGLNRLDKFRTQ
ncbi:MAG: tetratricopeptide repeat protein [Bacteroidales bacterium]|nr:tetratricopeptide repeat protein [Bacteroidales bacterium]